MNPEEDKFFIYDALNTLNSDINNFFLYIDAAEVVLVPFKINLNCTKPFNTFLLLHNFYNNNLQFPSINMGYQLESKQYFLTTMQNYLFSILMSNNNSEVVKYDSDSFNDLIDFKGFYIYGNKVYAFVDLTKLDFNMNLLKKEDLCWFALLDEIVNKNHVCNIPISDDVTDFFTNNISFIYFKNSKDEQIEIPTAVYTGCHENKLHFQYVFGNIASSETAILGSGYYFTNYKNAFRQGGWSPDYKEEIKYGKKITDENTNGKYSKGGIIRYAIFLCNNLVKNFKSNVDINHGEDDNLMLRISDHDGLWKDNYDSVYLGKIELDNGEVLQNTPIYVINNYHNHTPLSYHYIDKKLLSETFDENANYQIV